VRIELKKRGEVTELNSVQNGFEIEKKKSIGFTGEQRSIQFFSLFRVGFNGEILSKN